MDHKRCRSAKWWRRRPRRAFEQEQHGFAGDLGDGVFRLVARWIDHRLFVLHRFVGHVTVNPFARREEEVANIANPGGFNKVERAHHVDIPRQPWIVAAIAVAGNGREMNDGIGPFRNEVGHRGGPDIADPSTGERWGVRCRCPRPQCRDPEPAARARVR